MMKTYTGTKILDAQPMTRGEYNEYRGWTIPANENPSDAGYLVEYRDGGKANDSRHAGYISWSPADVFERTYKPVDADYTVVTPAKPDPHVPAAPVPSASVPPVAAPAEPVPSLHPYPAFPPSERT